VAQLARAVSGRFEVTVAAWGPGPLREAVAQAGAEYAELRHVRRPINPWRDLLGLLELVRLCRRVRPDIVHANSSKAGVLGRLAAVLTAVPIRIFTVHGWAFAAHRGFARRLYLWADRLMRPLTTVSICVAENERTVGVAARTCSPERTVVVHNAVDAAAVAVTRFDQSVSRIVSVGRFKYPKDFATLIEAFARLDPNFRAALVGDGPERAAIEAAVRRHGLAERVELLGERADVPALLAESDVFVLSSRSEGLPVSVLEAMAARLPVVATAVGGLPELVVEGQTGYLVSPGDPGALAAALRPLLADRDLRSRLGDAGRARVEERFDLTRFRHAHLDLYRRELERFGLPLPAAEPEPASANI
jgi:glycosyltransferase involved in cell wall biosynthesis